MLQFREMASSDLAEAFKIRLAVRENAVTRQRLKQYGVTTESMTAALRDSAKGWVCVDEGGVVGFAMGDGATGELMVLAVQPSHEGRGVGKRLMTLVQDWLFSKGCNALWLLTTPDPSFRAYRLYRSLGWRPTGEIINGDEKFVLERL